MSALLPKSFRTLSDTRVEIAGLRRRTFVRMRTDLVGNGVISCLRIVRSRARERKSNVPEQRHPNDQFFLLTLT